jgi:hypothetical protein
VSCAANRHAASPQSAARIRDRTGDAGGVDYKALISAAMRWLFLIIRTQRASALLRQARYVNPRGRFEEFGNVAHSKHAISHFLWNLATKFVLKAHGELDSVEAIGAEIVDEISFICYLISIDAEMFGNDALNPVANSTHRFFEPSFLKVQRAAILRAARSRSSLR